MRNCAIIHPLHLELETALPKFTGNPKSLPPRRGGGAAISIAASRVRIRIVRTLRLSEDRAYTETVKSQKQTYSQHPPLHDKTPFVNVRAPSPKAMADWMSAETLQRTFRPLKPITYGEHEDANVYVNS